MVASALGCAIGGKVLDVATQEGHFVQVLRANLRSYTQIVGVDIQEQAIKTAREKSKQEMTHFVVMNAEQMGFEDESFDTVSISASFHHLSNIRQVLAEMKRVLKPAGTFIIAEMHHDGQTEAMLTSIYLHQWVAEVDTALGCLHKHTLSRQEFEDYVRDLELNKAEFYDYVDSKSNPMDKSKIEQLDELIDKVLIRCERLATKDKLIHKGEELRRRLHQVGGQSEPIVFVIGKK